MHHTETINTETFTALKARQRYLILKHDPLLMPGDTLVVNEQDTRNQLSFEIDSITKLHSRQDILGLYAPYVANVEVKEVEQKQRDGVSDIPDSVGGVSSMRPQAPEM